MVKPAPTRTKSKVPVSLSPVRALSSASGEPQVDSPTAKTEKSPGKSPLPTVKPAAPIPPAMVRPAPPATSVALPTPVPQMPTPVAAGPKAEEPKPAAAPTAAPATLAKTASTEKTLPPAKTSAANTPAAKAEKKAAPSRIRIEKPAVRVVAPKLAEPKPLAAKPGAAKLVAAKPVASKPAASKAAASKPVAAKTVIPIPAAKVDAPQPRPVPEPKGVAEPKFAPESMGASIAQAVPVPRFAPAPASLGSLPLPRPPEAATVATATIMSQALTMARAFGALQSHMLDHACAELKATLGEAETLARTTSASEAIALQAKAVRRSYESYAEHLRELARVANAALRKD